MTKKGSPVAWVLKIEDLHDVRVTEAARHQSLATKARQGLGIRSQLAGHHFDRHALFEPQCLAAYTAAHAALTEQPLDAVRAIEHRAHQGGYHVGCHGSPSRGARTRTDERQASATTAATAQDDIKSASIGLARAQVKREPGKRRTYGLIRRPYPLS